MGFRVQGLGLRAQGLILNGPYKACLIQRTNPDPREDLESRSPNLGPYTSKDILGTPIKGSTFWILPGVWEVWEVVTGSDKASRFHPNALKPSEL